MKNNHTNSIMYGLKASTRLLIITLFMALGACATAVDYALLSKSAYEQDLYDEAIHNANLAIDKDPANGYSWLWLGMSQLKKVQYREAINSLSKAGELNSDVDLQKSVSHHIGYAYYRISDCDNAITFYSQNIALGPDWMTYLQRSYCYMEKSMFDEALSDAHHALQLVDSNNHAYVIKASRVIAFSHLGLGHTDKSLTMIKQLQNRYPRYDAWEDLLTIADISDNSHAKKELMQNRGWLGLDSLDYFNNDTYGAEIDSFLYDNPNTKSELLPGDIIVSLNNITVNNSSDLNNAITILKPGQPVVIKTLRPIAIKQPAEQPEEMDNNFTDSFTPKYKELTTNAATKSTPDSAATETLKQHTFYSVINAKKNHYKAANEALNSGRHATAFELYMTPSPERWRDSDILSKIIELYWETGKQIPTSDKASKDAYIANKTKSQIKNIIDLNKTIDLYKHIAQDTPWWAEIHNELAALYEQREDYLLSANSLKLYLISAIEESVEVVSGNSKAELVQKKIFDLEYRAHNK